MVRGTTVAVTISQVISSRPETLGNAAEVVNAAKTQIDHQLSEQQHRLDELALEWTGTAADSAQSSATTMLGYHRTYRDRLEHLHDAMTSGAASLCKLRSEVSGLVSSPETSLFNIADDGTVTFSGKLTLLTSVAPALKMYYACRRLMLETKIHTALAQFDAADKSCAYHMRQVNLGLAK